MISVFANLTAVIVILCPASVRGNATQEHIATIMTVSQSIEHASIYRAAREQCTVSHLGPFHLFFLFTS